MFLAIVAVLDEQKKTIGVKPHNTLMICWTGDGKSYTRLAFHDPLIIASEEACESIFS